MALVNIQALESARSFLWQEKFAVNMFIALPLVAIPSMHKGLNSSLCKVILEQNAQGGMMHAVGIERSCADSSF